MTGDPVTSGIFGPLAGKAVKKAIFPEPPKVSPIPQPDPSPTPVMTEEIQSAKSRVRARKKGRRATILAGRMMAGRRQILDTQFKTRLGE